MKNAPALWPYPLLFILGLTFYSSLMSTGPVTIDCLNLAIQSELTLKTHHLSHAFGFGYPLMILLGSLFTAIGHSLGISDNVHSVNFICVLFGSMTIVALYRLVFLLTDHLTALISSLILMFNPLFVDASSYGISHTPALFFLISGLTLLEEPQSDSALSSGFIFGLMGATRFQDLVLFSPLILWSFITGSSRSPKGMQKKKLFAFSAVAMTVVTLLHAPYFLDREYASQLNDFWQSGLTENFKGFFSDSLHAASLFISRSFSLVGIIFYAAGIFFVFSRQKKIFFFSVLWLLIPLEFYGNLVSTAPRFFTIMLPALIIPMSIYLVYLFRMKQLLCKSIAFISLLFIILWPLAHNIETFMRRHVYSLIGDYYRWVGESTQPNAVVISSDDGLFVTYYAHREPLSKPERAGHLTDQELSDFKKAVDNALNEQRPVYVTTMGLIAYDYYQEFRKFMHTNYRMIKLGEKPIELWYGTPLDPQLCLSEFFKVEKKH